MEVEIGERIAKTRHILDLQNKFQCPWFNGNSVMYMQQALSLVSYSVPFFLCVSKVIHQII